MYLSISYRHSSTEMIFVSDILTIYFDTTIALAYYTMGLPSKRRRHVLAQQALRNQELQKTHKEEESEDEVKFTYSEEE